MFLTGDLIQDYGTHQVQYLCMYYYDPAVYYYGQRSPRAPQSPFGSSPPDPLLISPQAVMSPSSSLRQGQQVSPQFNTVPMSSGYTGQAVSLAGGPSSFPGAPAIASGAPSFSPASSMTQSTASALHDFDMHFLDTSLGAMDSKNHSGELGLGTGSSTSQYVKQELRNICTARSEKQQQQQQQSQLQSMDFDTSSELPLEILETINDMSKEHGGPLSNHPLDEEEVVLHAREEARRRYQQFRKLSTSTQQASAIVEPTDEAGVKATSLFRNQLLRPVLNTPPVSGGKQMPQSSGKGMDSLSQVNILQTEPRTPIDDVRPADNKSSLLCQLLSE